jgi:SAM-dependent methyltransferase
MEGRKQGRAAEGDGERRQIRSRERVRDLAEVYTHEREVNAMLDLVTDMFPNAEDPGSTDRLFLEPACGHGNFLVEILRRKLAHVTPRHYGRGERFEHRVLRCLASVYGIDISDDNVRETRGRMRTLIVDHLARHLSAEERTAGFSDAVKAILETNIVRADTLADAAEIELVEYRPGSAGTFIREWSRPLDPAANEISLFSLDARCDDVPVHYSELARQTEPLLADPLRQRDAA